MMNPDSQYMKDESFSETIKDTVSLKLHPLKNAGAFWENQKESLKNMECDTLEAIGKKLERFT